MLLKKFHEKDKFKFWLIIITLTISLLVFMIRFVIEQRNNDVEMVMDYEDVLKLSAYTGETQERIYRAIQKDGITTICIPEDTLKSLSREGKATWLSGEEILNSLRLGQIQLRAISASAIYPGNYYVIIDRDSLYERVKNSLVNELGPQRVRELQRYVLEIKGHTDNLENIGLGIDEDLVSNLRYYNFNIMPKLINSKRLDEVSLGLKIEKIGQKEGITTIIFGQDEVLGYGNKMDIVVEKIKKNNLNIGYIEFANQKGAQALSAELPQQTIGIHTIPQDKLNILNKSTAVERFLLAAAERGIRILYIHPFLSDKIAVDLLTYNEEFLSDLKTRLEHRGFTVTPVKKMIIADNPLISIILVFLMSGGIAVIFYFFLQFFIPKLPENFCNIFIILMILSGVFSLQFGHFYQWRAMLALLIAIISPSYAMISQLPQDDNWHKKEHSAKEIIRLIWNIVIINAVGALIITGLLSDPQHMLKIYQFTGVKLAFIMPLVIVAAYYFLYPYRINALLFLIRRFMQSQVTIGYTLFVAAVLVFFGIYILRSGNYNVPMVNFESGFRRILGIIMLVRPRTKEFLIGYPVLFFTLTYLGSVLKYRYRWLLYTIATVAPISMINTFCHFHAPLWLSIFRSLNGLLLGLLIGYLAVIAYKFFERIWKFIF
jgi:hypothetical protein